MIYTPNTFFNNAGMAQMGWVTSVVMRVKLARRDNAALANVGNGSFIMSNYALATAVEYKIPVISLVIDNYGQSIERHGQLINYGQRSRKTANPIIQILLKSLRLTDRYSWYYSPPLFSFLPFHAATSKGKPAGFNIRESLKNPYEKRMKSGFASIYFPLDNSNMV